MDTPSSGLEATVELSPSDLSAESAGTPQPRALQLGFGTQLTSHEQQLLRTRLRAAALALFIGFAMFLIMYVLYDDGKPRGLMYQTHLITTAVVGLSAFSLCRNCRYSQRSLRIIEAIIFGTPACFFALMNISMLMQCAQDHGYLPDPFPPWIVLVFTYALFIPNRTMRAVSVIAAIAVAPILILGVMILTSNICQHAHNSNFMFWLQGSILMTMTGIIASLGASRIGSLRKAAIAAKELGQYRLQKLIGRGGMGEVYLAEHQLMKRPCAVKLIRQEKAADPQAIARFEREVQTAATLTHWNSVNVYDYGHTDDGTFYFVMEYLPGMSLQQLVDQHGPLSPGRAIYFLRQICNALNEAHSMGLVHRDLKPANIFAAHLGGQHDVAKLLDFGLVKQIDSGDNSDLTMMGMIAGSPLFMAPESATGEEEPDQRSDIYSLGAVAYFLLTGQPPFPGENPLRVLMSHANEEVAAPSSLADVPADLEQLVMQCLAKRPEDRPKSTAILEQQLADCVCAGQWDRFAASQWWSESAPQELAGAV